jgi:hypothetical protein
MSKVWTPLALDRVKKDNSNLWQHDSKLASALRKERFRKEDFEALSRYNEAVGISGTVNTIEETEISMDIKTFRETLSARDSGIFGLFLQGYGQVATAKMLGVSQPLVSIRLNKIREAFKEFYLD